MRRREVVALLGSAAVFAPGGEGKAQPRLLPTNGVSSPSWVAS